MPIGLYTLDVGQGQCVVCIGGTAANRQAAVIDAGTRGDRLRQWLADQGVRRIPAVVLTHNHADHVRGIFGLVESFAGRIGKLYYLIDQPPAKIPYWLPIQRWLREGKIEAAAKVCPEDRARPTYGKSLIARGLDGFQLYCIYPTEIELAAVAQRAPLEGIHPGGGNPNAASAVIRLVRSGTPEQTLALLGGDLTFQGWKRLREQKRDLRAEVLVVPHHGSTTGAADDFGPRHLAEAVRPRFALISVGTGNTHVHPRLELIRELRGVGATILCTQITSRCVESPEGLPGGAVLARTGQGPNLEGRGVACAGTIVVRVPDARPVDVLRLADHQAAVDRLPCASGRPMCRP
jgi:competence protein ComEC